MEDPDRETEMKRRTKMKEKKKKEKREQNRGCIQKIDTYKNGLAWSR
jgi:hypothetical protein